MNPLQWLWSALRRKEDLSEEFESHLQMAIADRIARGESPAEARGAATREFGNVPLIADVTRERWGWLRLEHFLQDLQFAFRQMCRSPGFTITAVLTLALGIGALTTVATWSNAVLYNPWPQVEAPRELRFIDATVLGSSGYSVHYDNYRFMRESGHSWTDAVAFSQTQVNLTETGTEARAFTAGLVSSNYFQFLGVRPQSGRFFSPSANDRAYGANDEIVLSDALWRDRFNADTSIVGRAISINGHAFTVVGIAPKDFAGIYGGVAEAAWIPLSGLRGLSADSPPDPLFQLHYGLQVAVRLRPGVSDASAAAELHALAHAFALQQHGDHGGRWDWNLRDAAHFQRGLFNMVGSQLPVLLSASALLMVLVCINIASLLGQHAARRRREVAIRSALGATATRIGAQVLAETGLLALGGALTGWAASIGMARALYVLLPNFGVPLAFNLHSDTRILLFVTAVAVAVTLACGIYPVRQSLRVSQNEALHEGGAAVAGSSRYKLGRRMLLGLQLGICFVVLVCCGLLTRTALNIANRTTGFDATNCLTASVALSRSGYTEQRGLAFQAALLDRVRSAPGVASATLTSHLPMGDDGSNNTRNFSIPGYVPAKGEDMQVVTDFEGPDFFRIMGIAVGQGREFEMRDNGTSTAIAVINEPMAHRYWPKGDAIGNNVIVDQRPRRIVGIVRDYAYSDPAYTGSDPLLFLPLAQNYSSDVILALRSRTTPSAVIAQLRQAVAALDSSLPLEDVRTLEQVTGERYQISRIPAELLSVYAISSVLVAMLGLYAVMAYSVIERHREFALRIALGSTRAAVFRLVLSGSAWTAVVGLVTGGLGSIAAVRLLRSMLFGVTPFDPASYCTAAALLLITVFISGVSPARRAASVQPMQALRTE
jgi:macrolide transport system ATP-binding/permease protein